MPKPLRVFFVSVAVLYALVLGWLVFATAHIAAAVPPALPPFECCAPYLRGSAAATLTVNAASVGSRPVLGSFAGHGVEVGYDGSTAALWTCFEVAPPLHDGSPLSVTVTAVNSDGSRSVFSRKGVLSHAL